MRSWITKVRLSIALDIKRALPEGFRRRVVRDPVPGLFEHDLTRLDRDLKASAVKPEPPPGFCEQLIQAVRASQDSAGARATRSSRRWLPAPAFAAALVLVVCWVGTHRRRSSPTTPPAAAAIEVGQMLAPELPNSFVEPLTGEWASLQRDLEHTSDFLLASLP